MSKIFQISIRLFVIAIPIICTYLLVAFYLDKSLLNFIPQWSDEIGYWHQIATFKTVGFDGGYYTVNELPPPASFTHFDPHGPIYPMLLGTLALITGWELNSAPLFNIAFFTLSIVFFISYTKLNKKQVLLTGLVILTFWPVHLYMMTNMRLVFFASLAIILVTLYFKILTKPDKVSATILIISFILLILLILLRLTNAILFIPFLLLIHKRIGFSKIQAMLAAIVLLALSYLVSDQIIAPFPFWFISKIPTVFSNSWSEGLRQFILHGLSNFRNFFDPTQHKLWLALRIQLIFIIMAGSWLFWRGIKKNEAQIQESIFVLTNSVLTLVGIVFFYDIGDWRDYRIFAPIVLMIILLFILCRRIFLVLLIIGLNLVTLPHFFHTYPTFMSDAFPEKQTAIAIEAFSEEIAPIIKYQKDNNAWCNTLLVPLPIAIDRHVLGVPPGIGISWFRSPRDLDNIKSRYLILDTNNYEIVKEFSSLEFKRTLTIGNLYINQEIECGK